MGLGLFRSEHRPGLSFGAFTDLGQAVGCPASREAHEGERKSRRQKMSQTHIVPLSL